MTTDLTPVQPLRVRYQPFRTRTLWHVAMDRAVGERSYERHILCGTVQGAFYVRTTPTSEWPADRLAWKVEGITCTRCARRFRKHMTDAAKETK